MPIMPLAITNLSDLIGPLIGGLGLFLLGMGMGMMTDGLKLAAGPALQGILGAATRTRWHALGSGVLVTGNRCYGCLPPHGAINRSTKMKQPPINKKTLTRGGSSDGYGIKVPRV